MNPRLRHDDSRGGATPRRSPRRLVAVLLTAVAMLLALGAGAGAGGATAAGAVAPAAGAQAGGPGAAASCPTGDVCISLPCPKTHCPTVEAGPTSQLGVDQWVYLTLVGFHKGDVVEADYCSDKVPLAKAPPLCDVTGTATLQYPQQELPIFPNGRATTSFHVESDLDSPGDTPFAGLVPGSQPQQTGAFWCDDGPNNCAIDIVDPYMTSNFSVTPQPSDTIVVPISFRSSTSGCAGAQFVYTSSDFSVEQLFPHESPVACAGAHPVIALDTASDALEAVQNLTSGSSQLAFVADPLSPDIQQALAATHHRFAFIPVAASAVVVGYQATMQQGAGTFYGFSSMKLTASQVAGLVTYNYSAPYGSDMVQCPLALARLLGGTTPGPCPLIEGLNANKGYTPAQSYGSFIPAYHSGVTRELVQWICTAPNPPVKVVGQLIDDPNLASHELTTSNYDKNWPIKTCTAFDQFPAVPSPSDAEYALLSAPAVQAKYLRAYLPPAQFENRPEAAFAPVDWSEARYQGLNVAALQNAAGAFVKPTTASVAAALADATAGPDGVLVPNFTKQDPAAYPLPSITYAVVPATPQPALIASQLKSLLDTLLSFTGGPGSIGLPDGFAPLPAAMYQSALKEVAADVVAAPPPPPPPPPPHHGGGGGRHHPVPPPGGGPTTTTTLPATAPTTTVPARHKPAAGPPKGPTPSSPSKPPPPGLLHFAGVVLHSSAFRWALPLVVGGGAVSLVPGGLLLLARRRRRAKA